MLAWPLAPVSALDWWRAGDLADGRVSHSGGQGYVAAWGSLALGSQGLLVFLLQVDGPLVSSILGRR